MEAEEWYISLMCPVCGSEILHPVSDIANAPITHCADDDGGDGDMIFLGIQALKGGKQNV